MKPFRLGEREYFATKTFLMNKWNEATKWEDRNLEIAYKALVDGEDRIELAKEYATTKQNVHRIVNNFTDTFIKNIQELGLYSLERNKEIEESALIEVLNDTIKNIHILAAYRGVSLKEQIEFVDKTNQYDKKTISKIIDMIFSEELDQARVYEWKVSQPLPGDWIKVNVELPEIHAKKVAKLERTLKSKIKGNQND